MVQQSCVKGDSTRGNEHIEEYIGVGHDHAMSFDTKDVAVLAVEGIIFNAREKPLNGECWSMSLRALALMIMNRCYYWLSYRRGYFWQRSCSRAATSKMGALDRQRYECIS